MYTVPSSSPSHLSLLPHFLPPRTSLPHTLVLVVLDWTRPWSFIEQLELWLAWIEIWAKGDGSRELEIIREESRERRAYFILGYLLTVSMILASCLRDGVLSWTCFHARSAYVWFEHETKHQGSPSRETMNGKEHKEKPIAWHLY